MSKLDKILDEYHKYLIHRKLVKETHAPYLVRWVKQFLRFAKDKTGHKFETVIEMFRSRAACGLAVRVPKARPTAKPQAANRWEKRGITTLVISAQ